MLKHLKEKYPVEIVCLTDNYWISEFKNRVYKGLAWEVRVYTNKNKSGKMIIKYVAGKRNKAVSEANKIAKQLEDEENKTGIFKVHNRCGKYAQTFIYKRHRNTPPYKSPSETQ